MGELVREEPRFAQAGIRIYQRMLAYSVVATFMMFLAEAHHVVAQREKKVIIAEVMRPIEGGGFRDQALVVVYQFGRDIESPSIVGSHIQFLRRLRPRIQRENTNELARLNRRIDQ